jgi:polysaccharide biosynthesis/export protein
MISRFICFIAIVLFFTSCVSSKQVAYFNDVEDSTTRYMLPTIEAPIQKNDILSITVSSLNAQASEVFNTTNNAVGKSTTTSGAQAQAGGYLVNNDGYIQMPILGNISTVGLTKTQLKQTITKAILDKKLLIDPIVDIRYLNFEVTVLGEVGKPAVISVPSERISLLKALGLAGDLTIYGKRENVLLIREENGVRKTIRLNLTSDNFLSSPYYYLKPNDVVYVEPNTVKIASAGKVQQYLPVAISSLSLLAIVLTRVIK